MDHREIQRLATAEMDESLFRAMVEHGEDLLVERKVQLPAAEKLGAEVASMANMLGGWILLGVDDATRQLQELQLPAGVDIQSHLGHLLRKAVDPVPPFLAGTLEVDKTRVGYIRVFEASVPVIVSGAGAVYIRDAGGKVPISDHRVLLDLARSGEQAEREAGERPSRNSLTQRVLGLPPERHPIQEFHMRMIVRAAPLTVTPQLAEWPVSGGSQACYEAAQWLGERLGAPAGFSNKVQPYGRAVAAYAAPLSPPPLSHYQAAAVADCAGIFGVAGSREAPNLLETHECRRDYIRPAVEAIDLILEKAEALGDAVLDLHLIQSRDVSLRNPNNGNHHPLSQVTHCGSAILTIPANEDDRAELAKRWEREVARSAGIPMWEG